MERPLHTGNDFGAAPSRNGDALADAGAGKLAPARACGGGIDLDCRGLRRRAGAHTMKLNIAPRIILYFTCMATVLIGAVGAFSYYQGSESLKAAVRAEILAAAIEKEAVLNRWLDDRLEDVARF